MRRRCLPLILLLVLASCGSSSAASEQSATGTTGTSTTGTSTTGTGTTDRVSTTCGPESAQTLAVSRRARVYLSAGQVYGCAIATGHSYHLGAGQRSLRQSHVGVIAVAGRYAGYGLSNFGVDTVSAQVIVRNLANGDVLHEAPAASRVLVESFQSIDSIVLKPDGAVAWISQVGSVVSHGRYLEVHRLDSRGEALLDSGAGIVSRSLRLHGSTLTWRNGSTARSASLG
ncbi:MAG TPA: hypothetical protein VGI50_07165 [Solirubrobacteraceae bacterium]